MSNKDLFILFTTLPQVVEATEKLYGMLRLAELKLVGPRTLHQVIRARVALCVRRRSAEVETRHVIIPSTVFLSSQVVDGKRESYHSLHSPTSKLRWFFTTVTATS